MTGTGPGEAGPGRLPRRGWSRLSSAQWTNAILVATAAVLIGAAVLGGLALHASSQAATRLTDRDSPAYLTAQALQASLLDQETGVRGYLLSGEQAALRPYTQGRDAETSSVSRLHSLGLDRRGAADVDEVERLADRWRQVFVTPALAAAGRSGPTLEPVLSQVGTRAFDDLRGQLGVMLTDLAAARRVSRDQMRTVDRWRNLTFAAILAAFALTGVLLAVLLRRGIIRPLRDLGALTRRVAYEDFDQPIAVHGPTDVAELGAAVETLRLQVVAELTNAVRARRLVEEQAAELRRSNGELEQFAYVASHDLQEPLRKVTSFCQMLERRYSAQLDDRARQYIGFAVDGAKRMQVLINDLLTFSRVGRMNDGTQQVDLERALSEALANLAARLEDNDATITHDPLPTVSGDPTLLTMLLQNLVGNAVKFRADDRPPVIHISVQRDGARWLIMVRDNGIGVAPQFGDKIFVIFQRLHTRDEYSGTGIGLALCKKIVEFHGGQIWLDPEYQGGTRIAFTLPAFALPAGADLPPTTDQDTPDQDTPERDVPDPEGAIAP